MVFLAITASACNRDSDQNTTETSFASVMSDYPGVVLFKQAPRITELPPVDRVLWNAAVRRGYHLTGRPSETALLEEVYLADGTVSFLAPAAKRAWNRLRTHANDAGIPLGLASAYRSVGRQRALFVEALGQFDISTPDLLRPDAQPVIDQILRRTAPPGFSRHHTGYAIDLSCAGKGGDQFVGTACDRWLRRADYRMARASGWAPSYPDSDGPAGPNPEPWELFFVP